MYVRTRVAPTPRVVGHRSESRVGGRGHFGERDTDSFYAISAARRQTMNWAVMLPSERN